MTILDKLTDVVSSLGDKASDTIEITKLKSKINSEKKAIELEMAKIGRIYYEKQQSGEVLTDEATLITARIKAHYSTIADVEKTLELYTSEENKK